MSRPSMFHGSWFMARLMNNKNWREDQEEPAQFLTFANWHKQSPDPVIYNLKSILLLPWSSRVAPRCQKYFQGYARLIIFFQGVGGMSEATK